MARVLTVDEAASLLRIAPYTLRSWLRKGRIKGRKVGRGYLIPESEIRAVTGLETEPAARPVARKSAMGTLSHLKPPHEHFEKVRLEEIEIEEERYKERFGK